MGSLKLCGSAKRRNRATSTPAGAVQSDQLAGETCVLSQKQRVARRPRPAGLSAHRKQDLHVVQPVNHQSHVVVDPAERHVLVDDRGPHTACVHQPLRRPAAAEGGDQLNADVAQHEDGLGHNCLGGGFPEESAARGSDGGPEADASKSGHASHPRCSIESQQRDAHCS